MDTYTTISGQTWDEVAYEAYGDEHFCDRLMDANRQLIGYLVFPAGIALSLPPKDELVKARAAEAVDEMDWRAILDARD